MMNLLKIRSFGSHGLLLVASAACPAAMILASTGVASGSQNRPLEPRDIIGMTEITEARLAPDGMRVLYATSRRNLDANRTTKSFWRVSTAGDAADSLAIDADASHLRWLPDGSTFSYLAPDTDGTAQVWVYDEEPRQVTSHERPVLSYEWSADGRRLAFTAARETSRTVLNEGRGVLIDRSRFFHERLLSDDPLKQHNAHYGDPPERIELWIQDAEGRGHRLVPGDLSVSGFAWSPDGRMLAITAHRGELGRLPIHFAPHDLLLYTLDDDRLEILQTGAGGDSLDDTVVYDQPLWSPDGDKIAYFRRDWRDRWEASAQLGVFALSERRTILFLPDEQFETYAPRAFWLHPDTVLVENTHRAGRRLFAVALADGSVTPVIQNQDWFDEHTFSTDGRRVAFVRERIDTPAQLYISDRTLREPRQLTNLNARLATAASHRIEGLSWQGEDGVQVDGWLYLPPGPPPFPLIVFVHGGPTWVYRNRYEPYLGIWPYALGLFADRGIAVLVPNYRGTGSYGKAFRRVSRLDAEPVSDIIAGIDTLVAAGVVDEDRLGIAGHSWGCWLGPLVAVRHRRFVTVACAEGSADEISNYGRNAGWMNSEIGEHYWGDGASAYEEPERYRSLSPAYAFQGLRTSFLFEAGQQTGALAGLEYGMAAWRAGVPYELVIYPSTGHNIGEPALMLEVMQRNLDWFDFWLLGREESDESKRVQYNRWRALQKEAGRGTG